MGTVGHDDTSAHRPTVTIVIPAWNAWAHTRRCLDALRPTLLTGDQVVVVDNGSHDETAHALTAYRWVEVVANAENQGFARACNHGAAVAQGEAVVFLNNDTVVAEGWLDELVAPLAGADIGAVGPRSDNVSGHQATAAVRYSPDQPDSFLRSVRAWRNQHRGETTEVHRLVGFCLAVRRDDFVRIGGFDERYAIGGFEDDDLCVRLEQLGLRLLVAHGSFVHHHGHATFDANDVDWRQVQKANRRRFVDAWGSEALPRAPLVSACLIVKDEEAMLPDCLESLRDLTSEVVVYDTGSSDDTVQIAREAGARVIEGHWESSFALARNAALAHAAGEWVLSIDADERLRADPEAVRRQLLDRAAERRGIPRRHREPSWRRQSALGAQRHQAVPSSFLRLGAPAPRTGRGGRRSSTSAPDRLPVRCADTAPRLRGRHLRGAQQERAQPPPRRSCAR